MVPAQSLTPAVICWADFSAGGSHGHTGIITSGSLQSELTDPDELFYLELSLKLLEQEDEKG